MPLTIYNINNAKIQSKMASFDYDWTLVNPKDGKTFPTSIDDWIWMYPNVPEKIKQYHKDGYMIVVFTNQSKKWKCDQIKLVMEQLDIPLFIVVATEKCDYKPNPILFNTPFGENEINKNESFFVGDALGRKSDFSDSDKVFAENIGVKLYSPEDIFTNKTKTFELACIPLSDKPEIIIMMGYPGSGKSTIAEKICKNDNYIHITGDIYKTSSKMKKASLEYISQSKSIVFDATHSSVKKRKEFTELGKLYNYNVKCIHVTTSLDISYKRNKSRCDEKQVPKIAYSVYKKYYEEPTEEEGFNLLVINNYD
jgi:bifunctional polynucleotide phosphatase/kinase